MKHFAAAFHLVRHQCPVLVAVAVFVLYPLLPSRDAKTC
jgi:hypothetical protein